jgi:hypothetical protein
MAVRRFKQGIEGLLRYQRIDPLDGFEAVEPSSD